MKYILSIILVSIFTLGCSEFEEFNQDLCIPVVCGSTQADKVNFAIYNDSGIDFDSFYFDVGGTSDSTDFLPLQQYTCWYNFDSLSTEYFIASGISETESFHSDTLWLDSEAEIYEEGAYLLEILRSDNNKLIFEFVEEFDGQCTDL